MSQSFAVLIHSLFSTWNAPWASRPPSSSSSSSSSSSPGEKWPAVWLPVLFLKGDVIYPQYQTLQSAGAECSTDTSIWQRAGREGESQEGWSEKDEIHAMRQKLKRWSTSTNDATARGSIPITASVVIRMHLQQVDKNVHTTVPVVEKTAERWGDEQPSGQRWNAKWEMLK